MPSDDKVMQAARLENWQLLYNPFHEQFALAGNVYGHPRLQDTHLIVTSRIPAFDGMVLSDVHLEEGQVVLTLNTAYTLGKVKSETS